MKKITRDVFVSDDGEEFMDEIEAIRHERCQQALLELQTLLFEVPERRDLEKDWGRDIVAEILMQVAFWMVTDSTSARFLKILRQLEEGAPAADPEPTKRILKT